VCTDTRLCACRRADGEDRTLWTPKERHGAVLDRFRVPLSANVPSDALKERPHAVQSCEQHHEATQQQQQVQEQVRPRDMCTGGDGEEGDVIVDFSLDAHGLPADHQVLVCGSSPALGAWDHHHAVELSRVYGTKPPCAQWHCQVHLAAAAMLLLRVVVRMCVVAISVQGGVR